MKTVLLLLLIGPPFPLLPYVNSSIVTILDLQTGICSNWYFYNVTLCNQAFECVLNAHIFHPYKN